MLTPVYAAFGLNLSALKLIPTLCFIGFLFLLWSVFKQKLPPLAIFFLVLITALNPFLYSFKENILSEYPFLFFLFLVFFLASKAGEAETVTSKAGLHFMLGIGLFFGLRLSFRWHNPDLCLGCPKFFAME